MTPMVAVPPPVRHAIATHHAAVAYLPRAVPHGYRYLRWRGGPTGIDVDFRGDGHVVTFHVTRGTPCRAWARPLARIRVGTKLVDWSATYENQQAWHCLGDPARTVVWATASVPGDEVVNRDARALAQLVASARRLAR